VSRNQEKIQEKLSEIRLNYPHIQTVGVQADLSVLTTMAGYRELLDRDEFKDMDIGFLSLNAGCWAMGPIDLVDDTEFEKQYSLNVLHVVYMARAFLDKTRTRAKRQAIVITSSGISLFNGLPGIQSYACTKKCVTAMAEIIHHELAPLDVDVLAWNAGGIDTKFTHGIEQRGTLSPHIAVRSMLKDVGKAATCDGVLSHQI
jgi:short-subunit dehydrogenase